MIQHYYILQCKVPHNCDSTWR